MSKLAAARDKELASLKQKQDAVEANEKELAEADPKPMATAVVRKTVTDQIARAGLQPTQIDEDDGNASQHSSDSHISNL